MAKKQKRNRTPTAEDQARKEAFGRVIVRYRTQRNLSQEQVAWSVKMSRTFISDLECGRKEPGMGTIFLIADAFGISASMLLAEVERELGKVTP